MTTFASLFSGFGGADIGAMQAGLKPIWGVEYDADIAGVAKTNGLDFMVADVREVDYSTLETPYWLHMSPVCKRASTANANAKEAVEDIETAQACVRAIVALRPPFISLENVRGYESFSAFHLIVRCLMDAGYNVAWWVLNSADYGVPQTRERLCLIASRTERVRKPIQTHAKEPPHETQLSMFDAPTVKRWVGWYEAIEDLLFELPDDKLARWQLKRLNAAMHKGMELESTVFIGGANKSESFLDFAIKNRPAIPGIRNGSSPIMTIPADYATNEAGRAILVDGMKQVTGMTMRPPRAPANVVTASNWKHPLKAVVADLSNCRTKKLNSRCLARFQAFPDWYKLPDSNKLACMGVGNAKPVTLQQAEIEAQLVAQKAVA